MSTSRKVAITNGTSDRLPESNQVSASGLALSAESVKRTMESLLRIREFVLANLEPGVDIIEMPGLERKILAQPGSEKIGYLLSGWYQHESKESELGEGHLEVVIVSRLVSHASGEVLGEGVGSCSTRETKYRYRNSKRTCPSCGSEQLNRSKHKPEWYCWAAKGGCGVTFPLDDPRVVNQTVGRVENPDIEDTRNTVRKMAAKRADIDCAKRTCCLSGFVTQDLDELPQQDDDGGSDRKAVTKPERTPPRQPKTTAHPAEPAYPPPYQRAGEPPVAPGRELWNKLQALVKRGNPDMLKGVRDFGRANDFPARIIDWSAEQAEAGDSELARLERAAANPDRVEVSPGSKFRTDLAARAAAHGFDNLVSEVAAWGRSRKFPSRMVDWTPDQISQGQALARDLILDHNRSQGE